MAFLLKLIDSGVEVLFADLPEKVALIAGMVALAVVKPFYP